jgi:hypothetical protein
LLVNLDLVALVAFFHREDLATQPGLGISAIMSLPELFFGTR